MLLKNNSKTSKIFFYKKKFLLFLIIICCLFLWKIFISDEKDNLQQEKLSVFRINQSREIKNFDPQIKRSSDMPLYDKRLIHLIHESLVTFEKKSDFLHKEPEVIKDNDKIIGYRFVLKPNIKFHNNKIFKPTDVKFTIERFLKKQPTDLIVSKFDLSKSKFDNEKSLIELYYKDKYSTDYMLEDLSQIYILNEEAFLNDEYKGSKIGLGPYCLKSFKENHNEEIILEKFPNYYQKEKGVDVFFERVIFTNKEELTAIEEIKQRKLSMVFDVQDFNLSLLNDKVEKQKDALYNLYCLFLNCHNTSKHVRQIIAKSIDLNEIFNQLNVSKEYFMIPKSFIYHPDLLGYDSDLSFIAKDTKKTFLEVKEMVSRLSIKEKTINFWHSPRKGVVNNFLEKIINRLVAVGFNVNRKMKNFDNLTKESSQYNSEHNIVVLSESINANNPFLSLETYFISKNKSHDGSDKIVCFENNEFNNTLKETNPTHNLNLKTNKIKNLNSILNQEVPVIPFLGVKNFIYLIDSRIEGIKIECGLINLKYCQLKH